MSWLFSVSELFCWFVLSPLFLFLVSLWTNCPSLHCCAKADWEKISRWGLGILGVPHSALSELPTKCTRLSCLRAPQVTRMADQSRGGGSGEDPELKQEGQAGQVVLLLLAWGCWWKKWGGRRSLIFSFHVLLCPKLWRVQGNEKIGIRVAESPQHSLAISSWDLMLTASSSTHSLSASRPLSSNALQKEVWTQRRRKQHSFLLDIFPLFGSP